MNKKDAKELRRQEQPIGEMQTLIVSTDASAVEPDAQMAVRAELDAAGKVKEMKKDQSVKVNKYMDMEE